MLTGSGNTSNHPTKSELIESIEVKISDLKKENELSEYLVKDYNVMSYQELRKYNSLLLAAIQMVNYGEVLP